METQNKILLGTATVLVVAVAVLLTQPVWEKQLAPRPKAAWVALAAAGSERAAVGPLELSAGAPFNLYAVLEAEESGGRTLYFTAAKQLRIAGQDIPAERIKPWTAVRPIVRARWFTLEGNRPYFEVANLDDLTYFQMKPFLRLEWPTGWVIPGEIAPANNDHLIKDSDEVQNSDFGTQRYQVRFEFYAAEGNMVPEQTLDSWGFDDLVAHLEDFPTVRRVLPGNAGPASKIFGLTQLELAETADPVVLRKINALARHGLAWSRLTVLRDVLEPTGKELEQLRWQPVDLATNRSLSAAPGDLIRVGERVVVYYQDRGQPGLLDPEDLCFDFFKGAAIRSLQKVFSGDGVVEVGPLGKA